VTHLPYIAGAYAIAIGVPLFLSIQVFFRVRSARQRLAAIDTRRERGRS
jgi:Heme exporter protein D (CcmD)